MMTLADQITVALPAPLTLPAPLRALCAWMEDQQQIVVGPTGARIRLLMPERVWDDPRNPAEEGIAQIQFFAHDPMDLASWFGHARPEVLQRIGVIARTGADGSMAALWCDDAGRQSIVHLGSGSGSTLVGTLTSDSIAFMQLLAIGYPELCWPEDYADAPRAAPAGSQAAQAQAAFRSWVTTTFGVAISARGVEIVPHIAALADETADDPFQHWVAANVAY